MNRKKIVIVGPNVGMGGVERASANYANLLNQRGFEVQYLSLIPDNRFFQLENGVTYVEPKFNSKSIEVIKTIFYLRKNISDFGPDYILAFTKFYSALCNLSLLLTSFQIIVLERSSPFYVWPLHIELFSKVSFFLKKPLGIISQTSVAVEVHKKYYRVKNAIVIPNPIAPIQVSNSDKEKWILLVGRLNDPCKGFDRFMEVMNVLRFPDNEWKVVLVGGDQNDALYLMKILKSDALKKRIQFIGKHGSIGEIYGRASIFAIPSRSEGFPNSLCEAMAAGLPCVSFDFVAGPRDLIQDGKNGYLVDDGDIVAMANQIERLMSDEQLRTRLGNDAKKMRDRLSYDKIAEMLSDFLDKN